MAVGPLFFLILAAILFVAVVIGFTGWALIPMAVCVIAAIFWAPILAFARKTATQRSAGPGGVPSTQESSYEPVVDPRERAEPGR